MDPEARRLIGCESKHRYISQSEARRAIRIVHKRRHTQLPLRAYRCAHCDGYHLTSQPRSGA